MLTSWSPEGTPRGPVAMQLPAARAACTGRGCLPGEGEPRDVAEKCADPEKSAGALKACAPGSASCEPGDRSADRHNCAVEKLRIVDAAPHRSTCPSVEFAGVPNQERMRLRARLAALRAPRAVGPKGFQGSRILRQADSRTLTTILRLASALLRNLRKTKKSTMSP